MTVGRWVAVFLGVGTLWLALLQARAAYGKNDLEGWPFSNAESKGGKLLYAAWMATIGTVIVLFASW